MTGEQLDKQTSRLCNKAGSWLVGEKGLEPLTSAM